MPRKKVKARYGKPKSSDEDSSNDDDDHSSDDDYNANGQDSREQRRALLYNGPYADTIMTNLQY